MSMLAERKVKQKWSLNPRGKVWSEDSNKFGQKMLEKMGWSKGKGLGAKENGIVEHLKISYKNDSKGMGFKDRNDQWTEHDSNFNALLESLSGEKTDKNGIKISSLEEKSQNSKVRVHYKKFTRGKDLSRCTEKDLASIFGKKSLTKIEEEIIEETTVKEKSDSFTRNSGSMVDYFKKKLPNYGKSNGYVVGSNGVLKKIEDESEEEQICVGFGFKSEKKRKSDSEITNVTPKKKKKEETEEVGLKNPAFDPMFTSVEIQKHVLNTIEEDAEGEEEDYKEEKKKRRNTEETLAEEDVLKEKKKTKRKKDQFLTVDNPSFDISSHSHHNVEVKRTKEESKNGVTEDIQNDSAIKKKKKKKSADDSLALDNPMFDTSNDCQNSYVDSNFEVKRKKKKKGKISEENGNSYTEEDSCQNNDFEVKRKKTKKDETLALDNPVFDSFNDGQNSFVDSNFEVKRKKKKNGIDNDNFDSFSEDNSCQNNGFEVKRKKSKLAVDNPTFDTSNDRPNSFVDPNFEVKRKKKDKKEENGIDNPNFVSNDCQNDESDVTIKKKKKATVDISNGDENEPSFDLILNVTSTPTVIKTDSVKKSSIKRRKSVRFSDVNEERIIPINGDIENRNELFEINSQVIANGLSSNLDLEENIDEISKKIDGFQAEIENDINEAKVTKFIGEVGNPDGENEKLPDGTRLKFKYANFGRSPSYIFKNSSKSRSSYKHLIKGDIVLSFNNTNLHEIAGYGVKKQK